MKLVIAEKPSVAASISTVLNAKKREDGFFIGNGYIVSWCVGHLVGLATADKYDEKYMKWSYEDLPIIPTEWKYSVSKDKKKQYKILSDLMKRSDVESVICATDAGREGELIFRLVYNQCKCTKPIERLWISSMEESAIVEGFENLSPGSDYDSLYNSALCRAQADWIVGINATRLFSVLYGSTLNIGRVVTPTLAMIVQRDNDIKGFVKELFYTVSLDCTEFIALGEKIKDKSQAENIQAACNGKSANIISVKKQEKSTAPPKLYDLTTLQREANRLHGYTAQQTLDYVQSLYEKKLATYPRTDSRYLTTDMTETIPKIVSLSAALFPDMDKNAIVINAEQVTDNSKVTDHHAIIPTKEAEKADIASLPTGEKSILQMLAFRLICAVGDKYTYSETAIEVSCEGNVFTAKGKVVIENGWKALEVKASDDTDKTLPELTEGQTFQNVKAEMKEGFTAPKKPFTEDTLLSAMEAAGSEDMPEDVERRGLGTPATRAGVIEKLVKSNFVKREKKQLIPTEKAHILIAVVPELITSPTLTAEWEQTLKGIESGKSQSNAFITGINAMITSIVQTNKTADPEKQKLFVSASKGEVVGKCPRCGSEVIENQKGFCCDNRVCQFALWKNNKFFTVKKKTITKAVAKALLSDGRVSMKGLFSEKSGKTYDAVILLNDTGDKYVNFKMEFPKERKNK